MADRGGLTNLTKWLRRELDRNSTICLQWVDKNTQQFRIPWTHKNSRGFRMELDGALLVVCYFVYVMFMRKYNV